MNKTMIFFLVSLFLASPVYAQNSFLDFLQPQRQSSSLIQCPNCQQMNDPDVNYCTNCGTPRRGNAHRSSENIYCPYCHKNFRIDSSNTYALCQHCGAENASNASYCQQCGQKIITSEFSVTCPYCRRDFPVRLSHSAPPSLYCSGCQRWYDGSKSGCPYCVSKKQSNKHKKHQSNSAVHVGSFTKSNYNKELKKFSIGGSTGNRSFSKVVIDVKITQQHAVIVNTVKVHKGSWIPYTISSRLTQGRNVLQVAVPQGASEIAISFDHGQGSEVKVYLE